MRRRKDKIDSNQHSIVEALRKIPGVTVEVGKDDVLVGRAGVTYWFEIKTPDQIKKDGSFKAGAIKESQEKLLETWCGHYRIVWSLEQILWDINIR